jgi:hypothetical protein
MIVGIIRQSASLPPMMLPTVMPPPNRSRIQVTAGTGTPVTSVRIGLM